MNKQIISITDEALELGREQPWTLPGTAHTKMRSSTTWTESYVTLQSHSSRTVSYPLLFEPTLCCDFATYWGKAFLAQRDTGSHLEHTKIWALFFALRVLISGRVDGCNCITSCLH